MELAEALRIARGRGEPFALAWGWAVHRATAGRPDRASWAEVFAETREAWRRSFEREEATAGDLALAALATDAPGVEELPARACEGCGADLDAVGKLRSNALYCSDDCRRRAAYARERRARAAA